MYIDFVIGKIKLNHDYFNTPFYKDTDFETYWNDLVYRSGDIIYTRKQMILFAANKLGGSHVDPEIPEKLLKIVGSSAPKLISEAYGESTIINCVAYQTSIQVSNNLKILIPDLEERICQ